MPFYGRLHYLSACALHGENQFHVKGETLNALRLENRSHLVHSEQFETALRIVDALHPSEAHRDSEERGQNFPCKRNARTTPSRPADDPCAIIHHLGQFREFGERRGFVHIAHQRPFAANGESGGADRRALSAIHVKAYYTDERGYGVGKSER